MDKLVKISNLTKRFTVTETRVTNCDANVYLGAFPNDEIERSGFVEFNSPSGAAVSELSKGYLLTVDKANFTRWHSDYMEAIDCLITLYGSGEKFWFFFPPSKMCGVLERCYTRKNEFIDCMRKYGSQMFYCRQFVGDTVYLPYGWLHCVVTINVHGICASLLSVGFKIPKKRREEVWKIMTSAITVDGSREDKKQQGPVSYWNY